MKNQGLRTVVVRTSIEYIVDVPDHFTQKNIEFLYTGSSHCTMNEISILCESDSNEGDCNCLNQETVYVREATGNDHDALTWAKEKQ